MKLASVGDGTYVASVKPGGAAEAVFGGHGLSADQGLRFKSVNGVDVFAEPKSACISQMKNVSSIDIVFKKDVAGFSKATASKPKPSAAPPPSTGGVEASDFDNMGRLAIIKHLRSKNIDYSQATNLEELRALGKSSSSSSASPPKAKRQTQTPEDTYEVPPQKQASKAQVPGSDIDNMGRLALIKMLRGMGVDYSQAKSIEELRALAKSSGSGGKEKEPKKAKGKAGKTPKIGTKWNTKLDRVASTKVLMSAGVPGGFLVRPSARSSSGLSLSVFQEGQVSNFNILLEGGQLKMANSPTAFKKIEDFILHYVQDADGAFAQPLVVLPQFK